MTLQRRFNDVVCLLGSKLINLQFKPKEYLLLDENNAKQDWI